MIRRWAIPLAPIDTRAVNLSQVHAVVSNAMDSDHWKNTKPWSIRPLAPVDGIAVLYITTVGAEAADRVTTSITPGMSMRFGSRTTTPLNGPTLMAEIGASDLAALPPQEATVVRFVTPTTFRRGDRSSPLPDPGAVYHSARNRWEALWREPAPVLPRGERSLGDLWVSDIDGRNTVFTAGRVTLSGFVGRVRYVAEGDGAGPFTQLLAFSSLVGLGSYPTRGLGCIELEQTWQPGSA